jgi:hypothetical protein
VPEKFGGGTRNDLFFGRRFVRCGIPHRLAMDEAQLQSNLEGQERVRAARRAARHCGHMGLQ